MLLRKSVISRIPPLVQTHRAFRQTPAYYIILFSECFVEFTFDPFQCEILCSN